MTKWKYTKGLHDLGNGCWGYLVPDGSWGWSNAGLIADGEATLLVDTLFDLKCTGDMLAEMRNAVPASEKIGVLVNTHADGDHTFGNQLVKGARIIGTEGTVSDFNRFDPKVPIADSVGALQRAIEAGKIGAYGVSEWSSAHIREAHGVYPMAAVQTEFSLWTRNVELGVLETEALDFDLVRSALADLDLIMDNLDGAEKRELLQNMIHQA
ncbi:MAG: aldo/keto reductase, partial [Martelella sp.]